MFCFFDIAKTRTNKIKAKQGDSNMSQHEIFSYISHFGVTSDWPEHSQSECVEDQKLDL